MAQATQIDFSITGVSPIGFSKAIQSPKNEQETHEDYERRCWKERAHTDAEGNVFIPPMAGKLALEDAARFRSEKITGNQTWTKHFTAGVLCFQPMYLGIHIDDVQGLWLHVPSDGKRGGSKRVWKCFPTVPEGWKTEGQFLLVDDKLQGQTGLQKVEKYWGDAGRFIGLGFFRPIRGGYFGRFKVESFAVA